MTAAEDNKSNIILLAEKVDAALKATLTSVLNNSTISSRLFLAVTPRHESAARALIGSMDSEALPLQVVTIAAGATYPALQALVRIGADDESDIFFLRSGTVVPPGWDARLSAVAAADQQVCTVSPLADAVSLFAVRDRMGEKPTATDAVDQLVLALSSRSYYEVPCFNCACVLLTRKAIDVITSQHCETGKDAQPWWWQLSEACAMQGGIHLLGDHLYVTTNCSCCAEQEHFLSDRQRVRQFMATHPLSGLRHSVNDALNREVSFSRLPGYDASPVQLHLIHGWGGGLELWARTYARGDHTRVNLVLKPEGTWGSFGQRLTLYAGLEDQQPLRSWNLPLPVRATEITSLAYRHILQEIINDFQVDAVIISSLIGHTLDALTTGRKTVVVTHDYYPFCPAISIYYNGLCDSCDFQRLRQCFTDNPHNIYFSNISAQQWMNLREAYLQRLLDNDIELIAPTPSVAANLRKLDSRFNQLAFHIVPHGLDMQVPGSFKHSPRPAGAKLRIVILGSLAVQKGGGLLRSCSDELLKKADIYLVGCGPEGERWKNVDGVHVVENYDREHLADLMAEIQPDLGLLLSLCTETFSYTLSELTIMGIPPLATDIGAFHDRIEPEVTGFLVAATPQAVVAMVKRLAADRALIATVAHNLKQQHHRTLEEMVDEYHHLVPLKAKQKTDWRLTAGDIKQQHVKQVRLTTLNGLDVEQYLHINKTFLYEKIACTPLLKPWQRVLGRKAVSTVYRGCTLCYRTLRKTRARDIC